MDQAGACATNAMLNCTRKPSARDLRPPTMKTIPQPRLTGALRLRGTFLAVLAATALLSMFNLRAATPMQIAQEAYLKASNTGAGDQFGWSAAVSGDTVVVGACQESSSATGINGNQGDNSAPGSGAAYVLVRSGGGWTQQACLKASNAGTNAQFGRSVAISGDTVVVGARYEAGNATGVNGNQSDRNSTDSGAAYVFVRHGTNWIQQAYLKASNTEADRPSSPSLSPPGNTNNFQDRLQRILVRAGGAEADSFGSSVAVSGDTIVVGAPGEDSNATGVNGNQSDNSGTNSGAAYVFIRRGTNWIQQAYLKASNAEAGCGFSPPGDANSFAERVRQIVAWTGAGVGDRFGSSVALSKDTIVVGAPGEDSNAAGVNGNQSDNTGTNSGAAYVFVRRGTNWGQQAYLKAFNTEVDDQFGGAVAIAGDTVVIGASGEDSSAIGANHDQTDNSATNSGAAYIFVRRGKTWSQQAYLKASNTGGDDAFGHSVALSGDRVVIGAPGEDSNAIGVNGEQSDNSATNSGAAYVFVRRGTKWTQQAYLKASNTEGYSPTAANRRVGGQSASPGSFTERLQNIISLAGGGIIMGEKFGTTVSVSGDTVVVGATGESSNAMGINGDQCDNSARDSGAAYAFNLKASPVPATPPEIAVEQPAGNDLRDGAASVDFGSAPVGGGSQRTFTVNNVGTAPLTVSGITFTGVNSNDFKVTAQPAASVSGPCGSTTITVTFAPSDTGTRTAALHITSNDSDESPFDITLTGTGLTPMQIAQQAYLKASNGTARDEFGYSVAVSGDTVVVGAPFEPATREIPAMWSGAVYVFVRDGATWTQQAYLKASNAGRQDMFGMSVGLSGDTVVVGAYQEDSNATGVNGQQDDNSAANSGAAYVFLRQGTNWTQQAYFKASNTESNDGFGYTVAVSGDMVVIGAPFESSNATGADGTQSDNSATNSGAAYVFVRHGTNWSQQTYLKASNARGGAWFGCSVAAAGDTVAVGAKQESNEATGVNGNQSGNRAWQSGAAYVFVRHGENWTQQAYLKASNTGVNDWFGGSVAVGNDTVVVGALGEASSATGVNGDPTDRSAPRSGAAYVFARHGTNWAQQAYLKASNAGAGDRFGGSVSVSGDVVLVGATEESSNATGVNGNQSDNNAKNSGAAYLFTRHGTNWIQQAYLKASNSGGGTNPRDTGDQFGNAVAVWGETVVVGANLEASGATVINGDQCNNSAPRAGAAYVFDLNATNVSAVPRTPPQITVEQPAGTKLGNKSSSIEFGTTLVGGYSQQVFTLRNSGTAPLTVSGLTFTGANASDFTVTAQPVSPLPLPCGSTFTVRFSPSGPGASTATLQVASNDSDESPFDITLTGTGVTAAEIGQQAFLKGSNTKSGDNFGEAVAMEGDTAVVGAPYAGAAFVFVRHGPNWSEQAYLKIPNARMFGHAVALSGDTVVVGASGESSKATGVNGDPTDRSAPGSGAAYVFVRNGTNWVQQAYLKASNTETNDGFGWSVSVSGDTVVAGARGEASKATGVNGDQNDNSAPSSGAAYVFVRQGANWSQQAYLKASNTGGRLTERMEPNSFGDQFGGAVSVSGDIVVVGAWGEASQATGVNGDQSDNSAPRSGAAYVFVRQGTSWSQQAYLKASNAGAGDLFGETVALSGDTVVVAARDEASSAREINGNQNDNRARTAGAVYVFVRNGTNWSQQAYLKASNADAYDFFGWSVAVSGDTVVVEASGEDSNAVGVNSTGTDPALNFNSGAAYVFLRRGTNWTQHAYLKAFNPGVNGDSHWSVAVSGNTVLAGSPWQASSSTGINGDQSDTSAWRAGAAYVFDLNAVRVAPKMTVEQPVGTRLRRGSASVDFGSTFLDPNSQRPFAVRNIGNAELTGLGVTITGAHASEFTIASPTKALLPGFSEMPFAVKFAPGALGARTAVLHITSNDSNESPFDITLTGTGLAPYAFTNFAGLPGTAGHEDGTGSAARFYYPHGVALDSEGNVFVADAWKHTIRKITPAGVVTTLAGSAGQTGSADGLGSAARFNRPEGVAVDSAGNVYVADFLNHTIRKITPAGVVTTLAGSAQEGGSADGTGGAARFGGRMRIESELRPELGGASGVAVDGAGNVYAADVCNHTIRKITPAGAVTTLAGTPGQTGSVDGAGAAARFYEPGGVAADSGGNVFVADTANHTIRKITPDGAVTTLAGSAGQRGSADGTGGAARFGHPRNVAADSAGNVYVADSWNSTIRKITPAGAVTTLAGSAGQRAYADGIGSAARFSSPCGVAVDSAGNLYVADRSNNRITKGTPIVLPTRAIRRMPVAQGPVLTGLISLDDPAAGRLQLALVEIPGRGAAWFAEGERREQYEVSHIIPATGQVTVWDGSKSNAVDLKLVNPDTGAPKIPTLQLRGAALPAVTDLYQTLTKRTVLRPALPPVPGRPGLHATIHASTQAEAAIALERIFNTNGLMVQPRGDKFVLILPAVGQHLQGELFRSIPEPPADATAAQAPQEVLPPGIINFLEIDPLRILPIWQELAGRTVIRPGSLLGNNISLRTETAISRAQAAWLLDAALRLAGVVVVPEGDKFAFAVPPTLTNGLPRFDRQATLAKAVPIDPLPPSPRGLVDVDAQYLVDRYASFTGRQPLPLATNLTAFKFSAVIQSPLDQAETIFLLEALARVNGAAFELVGTNQFRLVATENRITQGAPVAPGTPIRK
jgi:hypothetical protein